MGQLEYGYLSTASARRAASFFRSKLFRREEGVSLPSKRFRSSGDFMCIMEATLIGIHSYYTYNMSMLLCCRCCGS